MLRIQPLLRPSTLRAWYARREDIDFNPPFQRYDHLWSTEDKAYLIDSILNQYDIPKIYLADFGVLSSFEKFRELNPRKKTYAIIDGKQRFQSIFDFFEDRVKLSRSFIYNNDPSLNLIEFTFSDLRGKHPLIAQEFEDYHLDVVSVITDEPSEINELFLRLNRSKPLTEAEIRTAMRGIVPKLIDSISSHSLFHKSIRFSIKRQQHKKIAAKLLLMEFRGRFVDISEVKVDRFVKEGVQAETPNFQLASSRVMKVLDDMVRIFVQRDVLLSDPRRVPLYFWFVRTYNAVTNIREFLQFFEEERRLNREKAKQQDPQTNRDLLLFDLMEEQSDTRESLVTRFRILNDWYASFGDTRGHE